MMEVLVKLCIVFKVDGIVIVGIFVLFFDGVGFVVLMFGDKVKELGVIFIVWFVGYKVVGVDLKIMGIGFVYVIFEVLLFSNLFVEDIDLIELNEVFVF